MISAALAVFPLYINIPEYKVIFVEDPSTTFFSNLALG